MSIERTTNLCNTYFKGSFVDEDAINVAWPTAEAGAYCTNGDTDTIWIYDSGTAAWVDSGGGTGAVASVFGRSGTVTAASNDYTWAQVNKTISDLADIATKSHTSLSDKGTNTHANIDTHIANTSNPHSVTAAQAGAAPSANGVTNGDSHDHSGGDGAQINHTTLSNIGTNTHAQIDTHIAATAAHGISGAVVGTTDAQVVSAKELKNISETVVTDATFTGAETLNVANGNVFNLTLTGNVSGITVSNVPASGKRCKVEMVLIQGGAGSYTIIWPVTTKWHLGVAPVLSTTVGDIDIITLITIDGGTTWYGFIGGQDFA